MIMGVPQIRAGPGPCESASRLNHENPKLGFALPGGVHRIPDHVWNELAALWDEGSLGRPRPAGKSSLNFNISNNVTVNLLNHFNFN